MTTDLIGARLGNYEVEGPLGRGGMAHVYKAWDTTLKRPAAIKVIEPNLSAEARYRERFEREAQSIAALEHAHIVPVYYFGKTINLYYLAMKFVEGEDLGALMNRYAIAGEYLPADDILRIVEGVSGALDYAHRKGVIHRDVKPSNIMIDRDGHPYLTDFGLALNLSQGTIGDVLGTPHYVSPEQARSSANAVPQSDIYSLGVVLYELFTGVVPFDDPSPTAVALQHITKDPPAPRALNPDLSPELEAVILKAMAKQPENRYQSGKALAEALRAALQEQASSQAERPPLPPLPPGVQPPPPRRPSMRPVAAEVRASLSQHPTISPSQAARVSPSQSTPRRTRAVERQSTNTLAAEADTKQPLSYLPLLVLGGVILAVVVMVAVVASSLNRSASSVAALPTLAPTATSAPPTNTAIPATDVPPSVTPIPSSPSPELPTATLVPPSPTPEPPSPTPVPPTATLVPPTFTPEPPTSIPAAGPTAAPANWLPVHFIYTADAFYWMNDSGSTIRVESYVFERVDGSQRFEANRFAYYSMEPGRCVQIMFADVARIGCPEGRRPNAFFTPSRRQGVDFWTGGVGLFRVLRNGVEIAVCDIAAGQCSAYVPPS